MGIAQPSALQAIGVDLERCWKYDWVIEFDNPQALSTAGLTLY